MATVTFDHITKKYGEVTAVDDFNLEIADGEFMVFVGPSGCGKTTSLRMIAGLEDITAGTLSIGDRVVNDIAPKDRDIAMVFQSYALYPHMNVYDNLAFGLKLRKIDKKEIDRRVKEAAETIQLTTLLQRKPKELSGGQRQRSAGPSSASPPSSSWTSRCPTSTPSCASRRGPRSRASTSASRRRSSTSPTTRSRR
jgi:multiple sugar transport system ATP-binding protein